MSCLKHSAPRIVEVRSYLNQRPRPVLLEPSCSWLAGSRHLCILVQFTTIDFALHYTKFVSPNSGQYSFATKIKSTGSYFLKVFSERSSAKASTLIHFASDFKVAHGDSEVRTLR